MRLERERERNQMTNGFINLANQSEVYPESHGERGQDLKLGIDVVRFAF